MRITTVFNRLMALQGALVQDVEFAAEQAIVVTVRRRERRHRCPYCSYSTAARYDSKQRDWRHLSLGPWRVTIRCVLARLVCPTHDVTTEAVAWAEHDSRFTRDFEDLVAWVGVR